MESDRVMFLEYFGENKKKMSKSFIEENKFYRKSQKQVINDNLPIEL